MKIYTRLIVFCFLFILPPASFSAEKTTQDNFLDNLIVVEAENCIDTSGNFITDTKGTSGSNVFLVKNDDASGGAFIAPVPSPFRMYRDLPAPSEVKTTIEIPVSGRWYVHVRYSVTPENIRKLLSSSKPPGHFRMFARFKVVIENQECTCGIDQNPGMNFRWDSFSINLKAGKIPVRFIMPDLAGPDCIVFTQVPDYKPEVSDYEGPLWFRFKMQKGPDTAFYIICRLYFNPYESKKPVDAGWLFKEKVIESKENIDEMKKDTDQFLRVGQWSPWVKTIKNAKRPFCSMHVMFMPADTKQFRDAVKAGINNIDVVFQAATRPDERFLIHQATELSGPARGIRILMPHEPGLSGMRKWTKSFSEWADERLNLVKQTGAKSGEGPKKLQVFTDASATVYRDIDAIIESCKLAGFNGFDLAQNLIDETTLWQKIKDAGFNWTVAHHLTLNISPDWKTISNMSGSMQKIVEQQFYEKSKERVLNLLGSRPETRRRMLDLAILADEPNPQPPYLMINYIPALKKCFHEFLKDNGLKPEIFGKKSIEEIEAIGYMVRKSDTLAQILQGFGVMIEWKQTDTKTEQQDKEVTQAMQTSEEKELKSSENLKLVQVPLYRGIVNASSEEKRLYCWTQKFRSFYTRTIYGQGANVIKDLSETGWLKKDIKISPNFQAAPMMEARMWDGGLNLFEWARNNTTNCLLLEDWINDPYRVGFGFTLLNAASRKYNQPLGYLIVVDRNFRQRYLTGLAMGVKTFIDYSYGPTITKGPAWASSPEYTNDWCEMLRWTARCEDDIIKTRLRPADTAILIANSSEINSIFYSATNCETGLTGRAFGSRPLFRRAGIYTALIDGNIPVEIVSEEEILEDNALKRYKALYVVDTHVREDVQKEIKEWVRKGGTLWSDYIALARNEYDEDSKIMDEVFGLSNRGALPDPTKSPGNNAAKINVIDTENLEPVSFTGSLFMPRWILSTGEPLAKFDDGSPAVVYNRYGSGRAIIAGCSSLLFSPYSMQSRINPEFQKIRKIALVGANLAKITGYVTTVQGINAFVRDGENQSVLFLINSTGENQINVEVKLSITKNVSSAFDARGNKINFLQKNNEVIFTRSIQENDGDICVFRYTK